MLRAASRRDFEGLSGIPACAELVEASHPGRRQKEANLRRTLATSSAPSQPEA
jgi:hypothetical protein